MIFFFCWPQNWVFKCFIISSAIFNSLFSFTLEYLSLKSKNDKCFGNLNWCVNFIFCSFYISIASTWTFTHQKTLSRTHTFTLLTNPQLHSHQINNNPNWTFIAIFFSRFWHSYNSRKFLHFYILFHIHTQTIIEQRFDERCLYLPRNYLVVYLPIMLLQCLFR